jgi:hypothetical protein
MGEILQLQIKKVENPTNVNENTTYRLKLGYSLSKNSIGISVRKKLLKKCSS